MAVLFSTAAWAQSVCPLNGTTLNSKLICLIPQIYGPSALGGGRGSKNTTLVTNGHQGHFENDFLASFAPINEAVGIQVSQLPIASPSSSISFTYDLSLKTFVPSTQSTLGPILGERAETIGKNKLSVAFSYQDFHFDEIDGQNLSEIPAVYKHAPTLPSKKFGTAPCGASQFGQTPNSIGQQGLPPDYAGDPCFVRDFVQTRNNINLRLRQYTFYLTYGISRHFDISAAVPIVDVRMSVTSDATIMSHSVAPASMFFPGQ